MRRVGLIGCVAAQLVLATVLIGSADVWKEQRIVTIDMLGDEFLETVKMGDPIAIHEDGTVEVGRSNRHEDFQFANGVSPHSPCGPTPRVFVGRCDAGLPE
jgi:hypothetical protein